MMEAGLAERKRTVERAQWLRAAILGANAGLLSTTSLILGVSAAKEDRRSMVLSGIAGALAGAFSMAVGEYVSVSTQRDIEKLMRGKIVAGENSKENDFDDIELGQARYENSDASDHELPVRLSPTHRKWSLNLRMLNKDSSKTHKAENEVDEFERDALANPYIAAGASGLTFLCGAIVPIVPTLFVPSAEMKIVILLVAAIASVTLALSGGIRAYLGGSSIRISAIRVLVGGWIAMGVTYGILKAFDTGDE